MKLSKVDLKKLNQQDRIELLTRLNLVQGFAQSKENSTYVIGIVTLLTMFIFPLIASLFFIILIIKAVINLKESNKYLEETLSEYFINENKPIKKDNGR